MNHEVPFQKIAIQPVDCLKQAKNLVAGQYWTFVGICALGLLLGSVVPFGILMGPMMCGIFLCFFDRMHGVPVRSQTLFRGFDYFAESLIATLIMMGAMMALTVPLFVLVFIGMMGADASGHERGAAPIIWVLMAVFYAGFLLFALLVGTLFAFVYPLIVDRGLTAIPAIKTSFRAAGANLGGIVALILLNGLISLTAALFCYLPIFLVFPICTGAVAVAYRKVFPVAEWDG